MIPSKEREFSASFIRPFEWLTNAESLKSLITQHTECHSKQMQESKALNVGSGSSVVGEFLVEDLNFELVVNADKDEETMRKMEERWIERSSQSNCLERLKFCHVDFTMSPLPYEDGLFDLILDKSTLDCTLCSDNATASLLVEVYRCLAVGGSYLLISFHEHALLLPLLDSLPGAQWDITHTTMQRHVEDISRINDITRTQKSSSAPLQSGTDSKPLNVFIAKKVSGGGNHLDFDSVCRHVHECNDRWFQINQPLLTRARTDALKKAFASPLDLRSAYQELFTDSEKEHLTYDSFLEDWDAFLLLSKDAELPKDSISSNTALEFLEKMQ